MKKALLLVALIVAVVAPAAGAANRDAAGGALYSITNATTGNGVAYWARSSSGALTLVATYATGGVGTGAGLGSQGAVVLDDDVLFAVNAGSDSISEFAVKQDGLKLRSVFAAN